MHAGIPHPPEQTPPEQTPPKPGTPPGTKYTPPPTPPSPGLSTPPRLSTPPGTKYTPWKQTLAYGQRAAGTHPTGMFWNADMLQ